MEQANTLKEHIKKNWIDWIHLVLIVLLSPIFLFPSDKYIWFLCIIPVFWIVQYIMKKDLFKRTILDIPIFLLLIQVFITVRIVPDIEFSLSKITGVIFGIIVFYTLVNLLTSEKIINLAVVGFLGCGLFLTVFSALGMEWGSLKYIKSIQIASKITEAIPEMGWKLPGAGEGFNTTAVSGILILFIPLCFVFLISSSKRQKLFYFIPQKFIEFSFLIFEVFLLTILLILTNSLSSWVWLTITLFVIVFIFRKNFNFSTLAFLAIIVVFFISVFDYGTISKSLPHKINKRVKWWKVGVHTIKEHPLSGMGLNRVRTLPSIGYKRTHVHNQFLHTAAELGIPALVAYLAILFGIFIMIFKVWHKSEREWMKFTVLGLGGGQLAFFFFGIGDCIPLGSKLGLFFWISLGLIAGMYNYVKKG